MAARKYKPVRDGDKFGKLIAIKFVGRNIRRQAKWSFRCECGKRCIKELHNVLRGLVQSCGCGRYIGGRPPRHGMRKSREYQTWNHMLDRCQNPNHVKYKLYGGAGIKVCERWKVFENFYADMGLRPAGKSIDRINSYGNYEPGNCRWATSIEQNNNRKRHASCTLVY